MAKLRYRDWLLIELELGYFVLSLVVPEVDDSISTTSGHKWGGLIVRMKANVMNWVEHVGQTLFYFVALEGHYTIGFNLISLHEEIW